MVKCAVYECRSGYPLNKREREFANRTKTTPLKRSVFRFPVEKSLRGRWISAIKRYDTSWNPNHCGVCELHFEEDDFCEGDTTKRTKRTNKILKKQATPRKFTSSNK